MILSQNIFWDIEVGTLDNEKHARFIIERVLSRGQLTDWFAIKTYYGMERIKKEALRIRSLDMRTLHFLSRLFDLPKTQFRCYNTEPSIQQLWNY